MPRFKRTHSKLDDADSESDGEPTIGKRLNKHTKPPKNAPATHRKLRSSPQKLTVYIVAVKLGANRTVARLSNLVNESADYTLATNAEEADVIITGIGMRRRLERSIPAELIVSYLCARCISQHRPVPQDRKPVVTPEWLERSIKEGKRQPYRQYQALHVLRGKTPYDVETSDGRDGVSVHDEEVSTSVQADLSPSAKLACQRESPLVCANQELVEQIDVLKRARELDLNWQSALSYSRAIAVRSFEHRHPCRANLRSQ
jgi:DNA polymerase mu